MEPQFILGLILGLVVGIAGLVGFVFGRLAEQKLNERVRHEVKIASK